MYNLAIVYLGHHCINSSAVDLLHLHEEHEELREPFPRNGHRKTAAIQTTDFIPFVCNRMCNIMMCIVHD